VFLTNFFAVISGHKRPAARCKGMYYSHTVIFVFYPGRFFSQLKVAGLTPERFSPGSLTAWVFPSDR
jgi:hypothetical protein